MDRIKHTYSPQNWYLTGRGLINTPPPHTHTHTQLSLQVIKREPREGKSCPDETKILPRGIEILPRGIEILPRGREILAQKRPEREENLAMREGEISLRWWENLAQKEERERKSCPEEGGLNLVQREEKSDTYRISTVHGTIHQQCTNSYNWY